MADSAASQALELVTRLSKEVAKVRERLVDAESSIERIEAVLAPKGPKAKLSREHALANKRQAMAQAMKHRWKDKTPPPEPAVKKKRRPKKRAPA